MKKPPKKIRKRYPKWEEEARNRGEDDPNQDYEKRKVIKIIIICTWQEGRPLMGYGGEGEDDW